MLTKRFKCFQYSCLHLLRQWVTLVFFHHWHLPTFSFAAERQHREVLHLVCGGRQGHCEIKGTCCWHLFKQGTTSNMVDLQSNYTQLFFCLFFCPDQDFQVQSYFIEKCVTTRQTHLVVLTAADAWTVTIEASLFPVAVNPSWLFWDQWWPFT